MTTMNIDELAAHLRRFVHAHYGPQCGVEALKVMEAGHAGLTFGFRVVDRAATRARLILKLSPPACAARATPMSSPGAAAARAASRRPAGARRAVGRRRRGRVRHAVRDDGVPARAAVLRLAAGCGVRPGRRSRWRRCGSSASMRWPGCIASTGSATCPTGRRRARCATRSSAGTDPRQVARAAHGSRPASACASGCSRRLPRARRVGAGARRLPARQRALRRRPPDRRHRLGAGLDRQPAARRRLADDAGRRRRSWPARLAAGLSADAAGGRGRATGGDGETHEELPWYQALAGYRLGAISCLNVHLHRSGRRPDAIWERFAFAIPRDVRARRGDTRREADAPAHRR